ncbi:MAG: hypothetical protein JXA21_17140 [Anaerolineae bacterium]|nr:hypothetical protein [Anaerolineae bacterium]
MMLEKEQLQVSAGRWASIVKEQWQQTDMEHGVMVPLAQSGILAGAVGLTVFTVSALTIAPVGIAAGLGAVGACLAFTWSFFDGMAWARSVLVSREKWESEAAQQGQAEASRLTIEWVDRESGRMVFDELGVSLDTLQQIAQPGTQLSKRGLTSLGISEGQAMTVLARMVALNYAQRERDNAPAQWTSKGKALMRAFAGGGVVESALHQHSTSETEAGEGALVGI